MVEANEVEGDIEGLGDIDEALLGIGSGDGGEVSEFGWCAAGHLRLIVPWNGRYRFVHAREEFSCTRGKKHVEWGYLGVQAKGPTGRKENEMNGLELYGTLIQARRKVADCQDELMRLERLSPAWYKMHRVGTYLEKQAGHVMEGRTEDGEEIVTICGEDLREYVEYGTVDGGRVRMAAPQGWDRIEGGTGGCGVVVRDNGREYFIGGAK